MYLLLSHVLELLVLLIKRQPFGVIDISELVVLPPVVFLFALLSLAVVSFQILLEGLVFTKTCVKSVLNVIVNSSRHVLLDLNPFVSEHFVQFHKLQVFRYGPFFFVEVWVHIVVPSFTTLLANSTR